MGHIRLTDRHFHTIISLVIFGSIAFILIVAILTKRQLRFISSESILFSKTSAFDTITSVNINDTMLLEWSPRASPVMDFFIRTWSGDGHWLIYLLRSIEKYVPHTLYRDIIITFSSVETAYFQSYLPYFSLSIKLIPINDVFIRNGPNNGGYYSQMYSKFYAYQHSDADFFIHMDSDTIFKEPINRIDLLDEQNRVYVQRIKFDEMEKRYQVWQKPAERLLQEQVSYETMTGFPFVYPRDLYQNTIRLVEKRHNKSMIEVVRTVQDFIEFTTLGHYLITYMPNTRWIDNDKKSAKVIQSRSWGGFGPSQVAWYECILRAKDYKMCHLQQSVKNSDNNRACSIYVCLLLFASSLLIAWL